MGHLWRAGGHQGQSSIPGWGGQGHLEGQGSTEHPWGGRRALGARAQEAGVRLGPWGTGELRGLEHPRMAEWVRWGLGHLGGKGAMRGWGNPGGQKYRGL